MGDETALAVHGGSLPARPPVVTRDEIDTIKQTVAKGATDAELKLFLHDNARRGIHPLDRLIHFTVRVDRRTGERKYTPITSIDYMRTTAADSGEYAGNDDPTYQYAHGSNVPASATATVWRIVGGVRFAFTATARYGEYKPADGADVMWRRMPHLMIGKCAEALALRKAFPRQLSGLYAREEMEAADTFDAVGESVRDALPSPAIADRPSAIGETLRQALRETAPPAPRPAPPPPDPLTATKAPPTQPPDRPATNGAPKPVVRILAVEPPPAGSRARGYLRFVGGVDPNPIAYYADTVEQAAHDAQAAGVAVVVDIERSMMKEPNTPFVKAITEAITEATPSTTDDIPF